MAITLGVALFRDHLQQSNDSHATLALFSDSQTALQAIHSPLQPTPGQSLTKFIKNQICNYRIILLQVTWKALSVSSTEFPNHTPGLKAPAKEIANAFNRLEKGQAVAIF
ncbi:hypothetical protein CROQUDRAFT_99933 [Cronartium quercuum f. sp. fusiforme G11]|uniref:Uncharacterized protein n=1 Tax=Cronartium quercuum f. sp. fusiforme G11 TaxID=708437 RepID=A0A9P6N6N8_9BASI|nr:hypothetical protein CROQUDRAFT_99933 [Cronartium quercuum f. sp. fusiforme G11]